MAKKKEIKAPKANSSTEKDEEKKLLDEHPYETMSQIHNRYGKGRRKSGSEGADQIRRMNH
jgi:hypothetical protein